MADYGIVQEALKRGYTLDEIADKISTTEGLDPAAIRERGYSANDILSKLGYEQPAPEQQEAPRNLPGAAADVGKLIYDVPTQTMAAVGNLAEEDDPNASYDWRDKWREAGTQRTEERMRALGESAKERAAFGVTRGDIAEASGSTGFSLASMGAGLIGGAVASPAGPVAAGTALMGASGAAAYKMDKTMFTAQLIDAANNALKEERGSEMTPEERNALLERTADARNKHALWEAGPEAVGNLLTATGIGSVFKGVSKGVVSKIVGGLAKMYGGELSTETVTQMGQQQAEVNAGLSNEAPREWTSPEDWKQSFKEVYPSTMVISSLMGGGAAVAGKAVLTTKTQDPAETANRVLNTPETGDLSQDVDAAIAATNTEVGSGLIDAINASELIAPEPAQAATQSTQIPEPSLPPSQPVQEAQNGAILPPAPANTQSDSRATGAAADVLPARPGNVPSGTATGTGVDLVGGRLATARAEPSSVSKGEPVQPTARGRGKPLTQGEQNAIQVGRTTEEISRPRTTGIQGIRLSQQGEEIAGESKTAQAVTKLKVLSDGRYAAIGFTPEQIKAADPKAFIDGKGTGIFPAKTNKIQLERALGISTLPQDAILADGNRPFKNQMSALVDRKARGLNKTHITQKIEGGFALVPKNTLSKQEQVNAQTAQTVPQQTPQPETPAAAITPKNNVNRNTVVFQNRDRSTPALITQMQGIAKSPDYTRVAPGYEATSGAPIVADDLPATAVLGKKSIANTSNRKLEVQYAVVEADDLIASHLTDGTPVAEYEQGVPGRLRAIGGNARVAGIKEAYRNGTAGEYAAMLRDDTAHGVPAEAIARMKNPILVRVMRNEDVTPNIGIELNARTNAAPQTVDQAKDDARTFKIENIELSEDGSPTSNALKQFVLAMPENERAGLLDRGQPNKNAQDRLNAAIFYQAYGNDELVRIYAESTDEEAKAVISALAMAAPSMAKLEGMSVDVRDIVTDAAKIAVAARRAGKSLITASQQADIEYGPTTMWMVKYFAENVRAPKRIGEMLTILANRAYDESTKPSQDMFGEVQKKSAEQLLQEQGYEPRTTQGNGNQVRPEPIPVSRRGETNERDGQNQNQGDQAAAQPEQEYGLESYTAEELKQRQSRLDAIEQERIKLEAELAKQEKARREHEEIRRRSEAAAKTFALGHDAETNLSGQQSLFQKARHYDPNQLILQLDTQPVRPGEDTEQTRIDRAGLAASALLRGADGSLLGLSISTDWIRGKGSDLIGKRVTSPKDLATLGAVLRDPRTETFRYFLVKDGKIVYHTAVSSRMTGSTSAMVGNPEKFLSDLKETMGRIGADGYYLMHNHPSRLVQASRADISTTEHIANTLPGFLGHVILDHTEFGLIEVERGYKTLHAFDSGSRSLSVSGQDPTRSTALPHAKLDYVVGSPQALASMADAVRQPNNVVLVAVDGQMHVTGIMQVSRDSMRKGGISALKNLVRLRKAAGSTEVFAILPEGMKFDELSLDFTKRGWLLDVNIAVAGKSESAVDKNMMAMQRGSAKGGSRQGMVVDQPVTPYGQSDLFSKMEEAKNEEVAIAERKGSPQMDMFAEIYRDEKNLKPAPEAKPTAKAAQEAQPAAETKPTQEQQATAILDRANVTGKDRLDIMRDFRDGKHSLEDLEKAYLVKTTNEHILENAQNLKEQIDQEIAKIPTNRGVLEIEKNQSPYMAPDGNLTNHNRAHHEAVSRIMKTSEHPIHKFMAASGFIRIMGAESELNVETLNLPTDEQFAGLKRAAGDRPYHVDISGVDGKIIATVDALNIGELRRGLEAHFAQAEQPADVLTFEQFAARNKASRQDIGEAALHRSSENKSPNVHRRQVEAQAEADRQLILRRAELQKEYDQLVADGKIRPPTYKEQTINTANGHPDNESTQAARRIAEKRGWEWQTEQPAEVKPQDNLDIQQEQAQYEAGDNYEIRAKTTRDLPVTGTELATLRRDAAGIEAPERGITFRITEDGKAIVTGPKGIKVPDRFQKFADDHNLTLAIHRRQAFSGEGSPTYSEGKIGYTPAASSTAEKPMPMEYRESGALYFGEMGEHIDRTGNTMFSRISANNDAEYIRKESLLDGILNRVHQGLLDMNAYFDMRSAPLPEVERFVKENGISPSFSQSQSVVRNPFTISTLKSAINSAFSHVKDFAGLLEATGKVHFISNAQIGEHLGDGARFSKGTRKDVGYHTELITKYAEQTGWKVENTFGSGLSRSQYIDLQRPIEFDEDGEPTDYDTVKIRVSDHELPPTYKWMNGEADFEVTPDGVIHNDSSGDWVDALIFLADRSGIEPKGRANRYVSERKEMYAAEKRAAQEKSDMRSRNQNESEKRILDGIFEKELSVTKSGSGKTYYAITPTGEQMNFTKPEKSGDVYKTNVSFLNKDAHGFTAWPDVKFTGEQLSEFNKLDSEGRARYIYTQAKDSLIESIKRTQARRDVAASAQSDIRYSADNSRILAFVRDGQTHFVYDNISSTDDNVKGLAMHEIALHALSLGKSDAEFQKILKQIETLRRMGNKKVVAAFDAAKVSAEEYIKAKIGGTESAAFAKAWHGSPYDHNKFDMEYVGTGEGNQAYGHGLYFAGAKKVAEWYRAALSSDSLSGAAFSKDGVTLRGDEILPEYFKLGRIVNGYGGQDEVLEFRKDVPYQGAWSVKVKDTRSSALYGQQHSRWHATTPKLEDVEKALTAEGWSVSKGRLYQVELAPAEDEYLLWDRPLSEQSEKVKAVIAKAISLDEQKIFDDGQAAYYYISREKGSREAASKYLHSLGIRGIKYLDGSSRSKGEGNYNYVIFSDEDVSIEAKYSKRGTPISESDLPADYTKKRAEIIATEGYQDVLREEAAGYLVQNNPDLPIVQKLIARFRALLRSIGNSLPVMQRMQWFKWASDLSVEDIVLMAQDTMKTAPEALGFTITPELRSKVTSAGMPLFSKNLDFTNQQAQNNQEVNHEQTLRTATSEGNRVQPIGRAGQIIHTTVGGKPAATGWIGTTRAIRNGSPITLYRGSSVPLQASHFHLDALGRASQNPSSGLGVWLTTGEAEASGYGDVVEKFHLHIRNPKVIRVENLPGFESVEEAHAYREKLRTAGHDGIAIDARHLGKASVHFVAFDPHQVIYPADLSVEQPQVMYSRQSSIPGTAQPPAQPPRQGNIQLQGGQSGNRASWDSPEPSMFDDLVYRLQDKNIDLKRVVQAIKDAGRQVAEKWNAYLQEELFHGRAAKRVHDFVDTELKPLMTEMRMRGLTLADMDQYLHARHAKEANALIAERNPDIPDGGSGLTNQEVDDYFVSLPADKRKRLEATAKRVDAIIAKTREYYASYGLVSRDTVDGWADMFEHYVPLMREDHDGYMGIGQGFSIKGKEVKHRTGSTAKVVDILANIAMQREKAIVRGEKNRVAVALAGLAKLNPNPDFWSFDKPPSERVLNEKTGLVEERIDPTFKSKPNVVVAKIKDGNGQIHERAVIFNEHNERAARMSEAIKNLDASQLNGVLAVSAKITRYFASINTQYNPVFGMTNLVRDVQGAALNLTSTPLAGKQKEVLGHILSAAKGIYLDARAERKGAPATSKWAGLWEELQDQGGMTGYRDLYRNSEDRAKAIEHELDPNNWVNNKWGKVFTANGMLKVPLTKAQDMASPIFDWLSDYNLMMEGATRLSIYKTAIDRGMTKQAAASLAKNTTVNFNRKGQSGQQAGALYAFFNAAMQGTARIGQTIFDMESGDIRTLRLSKTGQKIVYGGVLLGVMQAFALAAAGFDDDDPPEFVRERSLIIPIGGKRYISIPMPLGFHVLPNLGRIPAEFAMGGFKNPAEQIIKLMGVFAEAFNPIGSAGISMQTIAPTALDPFAALAENRDWTGKPIYKEDFNSMKPTPGFTRNKDTASVWSKFIAESINFVSGGTDYTPGVFSPTADQIDYLIGQVTGGVGREISKTFQTGEALITGESLPTHKMPLVGRFYGDSENQSNQGNKYYANMKEINLIEMELNGRREDHLPTDEFRKENPKAQLIARAKYADKIISRLRKQKREMIEKGVDREKVQQIEDRITAEMLRFNQAVDKFEARTS